jgi:hypothetical protein
LGKIWTSSLHQKKRRLQGKTKIYATSAAGSVAEEGVEEIAPALAEASTHMSQESKRPAWKSKKPPKE